MNTVIGIYLQFAFFIVLPAAAYGAVFQKAGYSPWLGLLMLLPVINLIALVWFASTTWPLELGYERTTARDYISSKSDTPWEFKMAIRKGLALEQRGQIHEALATFAAVATRAKDLPVGELAQGHVTRLKSTLGENTG